MEGVITHGKMDSLMRVVSLMVYVTELEYCKIKGRIYIRDILTTNKLMGSAKSTLTRMTHIKEQSQMVCLEKEEC